MDAKTWTRGQDTPPHRLGYSAADVREGKLPPPVELGYLAREERECPGVHPTRDELRELLNFRYEDLLEQEMFLWHSADQPYPGHERDVMCARQRLRVLVMALGTIEASEIMALVESSLKHNKNLRVFLEGSASEQKELRARLTKELAGCPPDAPGPDTTVGDADRATA